TVDQPRIRQLRAAAVHARETQHSLQPRLSERAGGPDFHLIARLEERRRKPTGHASRRAADQFPRRDDERRRSARVPLRRARPERRAPGALLLARHDPRRPVRLPTALGDRRSTGTPGGRPGPREIGCVEKGAGVAPNYWEDGIVDTG